MALIAAIHRGEWTPILILLSAAVVGLVVHFVQSRLRKRNLEAAAAKYGGRVETSFGGNSWLEFDVDGIPGQVTWETGRRPFTQVLWNFIPGGQLRVVPEGLFTALRKIFGTQDVDVGDAPFDRRFLIQGSTENWIRSILDPDARQSVTRLYELGRSGWIWDGGRLAIDAGPGGVRVTVGRMLVGRRERLMDFMAAAVALFQKIRMPSTEGVVILSARQLAGQGNCPVCASPLDMTPRRCPSCGTPHHGDCWTYLGGCAIYGCTRRRGG